MCPVWYSLFYALRSHHINAVDAASCGGPRSARKTLFLHQPRRGKGRAWTIGLSAGWGQILYGALFDVLKSADMAQGL